ncbi:hypothetical protein DWU98_06750 [Dyella monticola]|uniref:TraB/GumN family protein n=1 Tax=Dyella monticola TaxID=1927958 RepID=A0A370X3F9_9GAMM|nr:hypothetical protein DWU98_06750 [Dyella monticola]
MYVDWAAGNQAPASTEVERYSRDYPELAEELTFRRNKAWLPRFETMLASKSTSIVIVGLFHMVGPRGILSLCKKEGLSVERLSLIEATQRVHNAGH